MARITETKVVCDICMNPRRKVKTYRIGQDGELVEVHLCISEHCKPIEDLIAKGSPIRTTTPKVKVWEMDEIEALARKKKSRP